MDIASLIISGALYYPTDSIVTVKIRLILYL